MRHKQEHGSELGRTARQRAERVFALHSYGRSPYWIRINFKYSGPCYDPSYHAALLMETYRQRLVDPKHPSDTRF